MTSARRTNEPAPDRESRNERRAVGAPASGRAPLALEALGAFAGNRAVTRLLEPADTVRRQVYGSDPTGQSDPNAIIPVADFIGYVEDVESTYRNDSPEEILTRIRQLYYSGVAFDQLIPDAPTTERVAYTKAGPIDRRRTVGSAVGTDAYEHLTARADENALGDNPSPYVELANGERIDVGHLLLGMDALAHPDAGYPYTGYDVPAIDPASWVADLGIAAVWMEYHEDEGEASSDVPDGAAPATADLAAYYRISAPVEDLLGDIDSFGAASGYRPPMTLSQTLRSYYLGGSGSAAGIETRFQTFCATNNLRYTVAGGTVTWDAASRTFWIDRIDDFNDLYSDGNWSMFGGWADDDHTWRHTPAVLDMFLEWLRPQLEAELAR